MERRAGVRVMTTVGCRLSRGTGSPVTGQTVDLGTTGMRVATSRPLRVDEALGFELEPPGLPPVTGQARVMREQALGVYAVRFERLGDDARRELERLVVARAVAYNPRDT